MTRSMPPTVEDTDIGTQYLVNGVKPVTVKDKLAVLAEQPMTPKQPCQQKPCDIGLFDEVSRNQLEMF